MTITDLTMLREKLGKKYIKELMIKTGLSRSTIHGVMRGEWENQMVLDAAHSILTERQERDNQINQLTKR